MAAVIPMEIPLDNPKPDIVTTPPTSTQPDHLAALSANATVIDARGLLCPQPLIRVRAQTRSGRAGDRYLIIADDAQADLDLEVWTYRMQHELEYKRLKDGVWTFVLRLGRRATGE